MEKSFRNILRRISAALIIGTVLVNCTGCNALLKTFAARQIENMVNDSFTQYLESKGSFDINGLCKKKSDMSEYTEEQLALYGKSLNKTTFEILETTVKDSRESGTCTVEFKKAPDFSKWDLWIATEDDYEDALGSMKRKTVKITFKMTKNSDGDWKFDNLEKFYSSFLEPFKELCILDEDGTPINITKKYVETFYVDSAWYDENMGNPAEEGYLINTHTLNCVFYFNAPVDLELKAFLYKDGSEIADTEISVVNSVVASVCFYADEDSLDETYDRGTYKIAIGIGDKIIAESADIMVR